MEPNDILTPAIQQGWKNIIAELQSLLHSTPEGTEDFYLVQKLEFIFNELIMEKGAIRTSDRKSIPEYVQLAKNFLDTHRI